jgi:uncharacterized surface protein with fasciclin (FAS1) repeats
LLVNNFLFYKVRPETIFAPTDAAFSALPAGVLDELLADKKRLHTFINTHILSDNEYSRGLECGPVLTTSGFTVEVKVTPGELEISFPTSCYNNK